MKIVHPAEIEKRLAFARKATDHFATHPKHYTYTDGSIQAEALLAIRWGLDIERPNAVVVLRIADEAPVIYGDMDHDRKARREDRAERYRVALQAIVTLDPTEERGPLTLAGCQKVAADALGEELRF